MKSFCPKCGTELAAPDIKFCPGCGTATGKAKKESSGIKIGCLLVAGIPILLWIIGQNLPTPTPQLVTYEVIGSGTVGLTFQNESGGTEQKTVSLPWTLVLRARHGAFLYLAAQKQQERGTIRAAIYVNGQPIQSAEANSSYGIASVSGSVP
jgi:hypothetical protein